MLSNLWHRFRSVASSWKSRELRRKPSRSDHRRGTVLHAEQLEQRQLLSANQISLNTSTSTLIIKGTTGADNAKVWTDTSNVVHVSLNTPTESLSASFARSSVNSIEFAGDAGDDRFENTTNINCFASGDAGNDVFIGGTGTNYFLGGADSDQLFGNVAVDSLYGEDGNDLLSGGGGNDRLEGAAGDDTLNGGAGDDALLGADGNDTINGDDGNDWLQGAIGNDVLRGGAGNDDLTGADGNDQLYGDDDVDTLYGDTGDDYLVGGAGNDTVNGGTGIDTLLGGLGDDGLYGNDGNDQLSGEDGNDSLVGANGNDVLDGGAGTDNLVGGIGDDQLLGGDNNDTLNGEAGNDTLDGGAGNDGLAGDIGDDVIHGGIGDDSLVGGDGNDQLYGDDGNDWLSGEAGDDQLIGNAGIDRLEGGTGIDTLLGGLGDDALYGNDGNDQLTGEDGIDLLDGGNGNDLLDGGSGTDSLFGGIGDDQLVGGDNDDTLDGQAGNDWLDGGAGNDGLGGDVGDDVIHGGLGDDSAVGGDGNDQLYGDDGNDWLSGEAGDDVLIGNAGIDRLEGGVGDDTLFGSAGDDALVGGDGNDALYGAMGNDWLHGGAGNDLIRGATGDDTVIGDVGNDKLYGNDGVDTLNGDDGDDYLEAGAGNDTVDGGAGIDSLFGGLGDDALYGDDGNDQLTGEGGNDHLDGGNGNDLLDGGSGTDNLLGGIGDDQLLGGDNDDTLNGHAGNDWLDGGAGNDGLGGDVGDDVIHGGLGDDSIVGGDGNDQLYGEDGNDWLFGEAGDDQLMGNAGIDRLEGAAGNDTLYGSAGDDSLYGDDGNDMLFGAIGNDWLHGGAGDDVVRGATGDDTLFGDDGSDQLYADDGVDNLYGNNGSDYLVGGNGNDLLDGGLNDDVIGGGAGDDTLYGVDGADFLYGDDGDDRLETGAGRGVLLGGAGVDQLIGGASNDVLIGGTGKDDLAGKSGDDLLIGGTTEFDTDITKLQAIAAVWNNGTPYASRIEQMMDEAFVAHLQPVESVIDDQVADTVSGAAGQDWFFETGYMGVYRPSDVEWHEHHDDTGGSHSHAQIIVDELPELEGYEFIDSLDKFSDRQTNETISSLVPHADNATLQREHLSLFQLVRYDQVTDYAMRSGNWSDPTIWHDGVVPAAGSKVLIPIGVDVRVDGMIPARLATVRVDGTLLFNTTVNTELRVDTVVVSASGTFEMGTAAAPIAPNVTARLFITDNGAIDRSWDAFGISRGLIAHGTVSIFGSQVDSYQALAGPAIAGTQSLSLKAIPSGWKVGDSVVIAATTPGATQNESRTITAIFGNVITLDRPLTYSHVAASANLDVHVANTTRNAVIESETTTIERRGHVMFMHNRDVNIGYAGFYELGRTDKSKPLNDSVVQSDWTLKPGTGTNQRARYSVHFHRNGLDDDSNPSVIFGSAVVDSPGWGYVNHSSNVDMTNNVAFGVNGASFATEVGDEIGSFNGNLAIGTTGAAEGIDDRSLIHDFGFIGSGFWFQGAGASVVGNISAGNYGEAFVYYTQGLTEGGVIKQFPTENLVDPSIAQGAASIPVGRVPIREFRDNIGYASNIGLRIRYHLQHVTDGQNSLVEGSIFWNNGTGVLLIYAENVTLRNDTIVTATSQPQLVGVHSGPLESDNLLFDNLTISGYTTGIDMPRRGTAVVNGGTFSNNMFDISLRSAAVYDRNVLITNQTGQTKIKTQFDINPVPGISATAFMVKDVILLNFGPFANQRLYNVSQLATYIPFPIPRSDVPANYVGLTNLQLWTLYGVALGGEIAPNNFTTVPYISGLIGPPV